MQNRYATLILAAFCVPCTGYSFQSSAGVTPAQNPPAQSVSSTPGSDAPAKSALPNPSGLLQPALDTLQQAVGALQVERWKRGSVRDEAAANIASIQQDLQTTLPALEKEADANPGAISKALPVSRNINALYDVVLRVVDGARVAAPGDQFAQLQDAISALQKARHLYDDRIQNGAAAQEKQIGDLQIAVKAEAKPAPVCPVVPAAAPEAPAKKTTPRKRKPAAKPATPPPATNVQPANSQSNTPPKPNQ